MVGASLPAEVQAAAERGGFSGAEYNAVAMNAQLDTIKLVNLVLETNPELQQSEGARELAFERKLLSCRFDEPNHVAAAIFQFCVGARREGKDEFRCVGDYAVLYNVPEGSTPEAATAFCKHVGSFAAYPYFRAVAAQMAWNAGVNLPPLPSIAAMPVVPKPPKKPAQSKASAMKPGKQKKRQANQ